MSILIADSGATKTDWLYVDDNEFVHIQTQGLHPATIDGDDDEIEIRDLVGEFNPEVVHFYGTGCGNPVSDQIIKRFLSPIFSESKIIIRTDLEGCGKAFFGDESGVVAILGTGSICAKIENGNVAKKSASLGYAIGDEGSAADLGRRLLKIYYRKYVDEETLNFIGEKLGHSEYGDMMNQIYSSSKPNRVLASIAGNVFIPPFPDELNKVLKDTFSDFITYQLSQLSLKKEERIVFTGKVALSHKELLLDEMKNFGYENVEVIYPVIFAWRERLKQNQNF